MQQLSLVPVCEKHGCEKKWVANKARKTGGQWKCVRCQKELHDKWKATPGNQAKYDQQRREWALLNPDSVRATGKKHRAANSEKERQRCAKKRLANQPRYSYLSRRRYARKLGCLVSLDQIDRAICDAFYAKAEKLGLTVDHIQPLYLQGDHAPWNFELLTLSENSAKQARRPTLKEVMRGERRYRLLRRIFEREARMASATRAA